MTWSLATPTCVAPSPTSCSVEPTTPIVAAYGPGLVVAGRLPEVLAEQLVGPVDQMDAHGATVVAKDVSRLGQVRPMNCPWRTNFRRLRLGRRRHRANLRRPCTRSAARSTTEILASTIAGAVERQLTHYMSVMSQQVEATRQAAEAARLAMQADFAQQLESLTARLDGNQQANDRYQAALQAALEERLAEFANHQHQTLTTINSKLASLPSLVQAELPAQFAVVSQGMRDYLEHKTSAIETQIDDLHKSSRRFDEQAASIVAHINETVAALYRRMDDGDQTVTREPSNSVSATSADWSIRPGPTSLGNWPSMVRSCRNASTPST